MGTFGKTPALIRPLGQVTAAGQRRWNVDLIKNLHDLLSRITADLDALIPNIPTGFLGGRLRANAAETGIEWVEGPKRGTDTIASAASTVAVTFATAFATANFAVAVAPALEEVVWVTSKAATGFTLNRSNTAATLAVDWTAGLYEDL